MVTYNLSHLQQHDSQKVKGPIQDDEALLLFSMIRCMRIRRILEVGGLHGYSAKNFIAAMDGLDGMLYTIDVAVVPKVANNHVVIRKKAADVRAADVGHESFDLVFYDCHHISQMDLHRELYKTGVINDETVIALHDTNVHWYDNQPKLHQRCEREMANNFKDIGYDVIHVHTKGPIKGDVLWQRHGLTICQKYKTLPLNDADCAPFKLHNQQNSR